MSVRAARTSNHWPRSRVRPGKQRRAVRRAARVRVRARRREDCGAQKASRGRARPPRRARTAGDEGDAEREQHVGEDAPDEHRLLNRDEVVAEGGDKDHKLGGIPEGGVDEAAGDVADPAGRRAGRRGSEGWRSEPVAVCPRSRWAPAECRRRWGRWRGVLRPRGGTCVPGGKGRISHAGRHSGR